MTWLIDNNHAEINFWVRHMMISKVRGRFTDFEGTVEFNEENPERSSVNVTIDADSITTRNNDRDNHLKSGDFLDVATYPTITFVSKRIEQTDGDSGKIVGDLTIRDVTQEIVLDVDYNGIAKSPYGTTSAGFSAQAKIDRSDFGATWNAALETGGVLVGDTVHIEIELEIIKQAQQAGESVA